MLLPCQVGQLVSTSASEDPANLAIYGIAFYLTTLGIIYVQEAERRIPINYSGRWALFATALRPLTRCLFTPGTATPFLHSSGGCTAPQGAQQRKVAL